MSLDYYFKPIQSKSEQSDKKPSTSRQNQPNRKEDDVEVLPGYYTKKRLYDLMYDHQKEGLRWLFSLHQQRKGCILADGRVIQFLSSISSSSNEISFVSHPVGDCH